MCAIAKSGDVHDYMDVVVRAKHGARADDYMAGSLLPAEPKYAHPCVQ